MGWTGTRYSGPLTRQQRIEMAIEQEGYNYENDIRRMEVIDAALRGSTAYLACRVQYKDGRPDEVIAAVILTSCDGAWFNTKGMDEIMVPSYYQCPKRILDRLTPTENEYALEWRQHCRAALAYKDPLTTLPQGSVIRLHDPGQTLLTVGKYKGRRTFLGSGIKASLHCIRSWGYDVIQDG